MKAWTDVSASRFRQDGERCLSRFWARLTLLGIRSLDNNIGQ
jgi:hypothetical protein